MKLEVVVVPVSDVNRAKDFYQALGWRLDADFVTAPDFRVIQMTPPGSACDGNSWFVQEVTTRLPGRATSAPAAYDSVARLAGALRRAAAAHGKHEEETGQPDPDWPERRELRKIGHRDYMVLAPIDVFESLGGKAAFGRIIAPDHRAALRQAAAVLGQGYQSGTIERSLFDTMATEPPTYGGPDATYPAR
jgi:catechol 2,3-dioxygenase-like lactoylglutathione lyase family enzyme